MKTRKGYVSNSSSSSFIVGFKVVPKDVLDMQRLLFGTDVYLGSPYTPERWAATEIAEIVFNDMAGQEPLTRSGMIEEMVAGYFPGRHDYDFHDFPQWEKEVETEAQYHARVAGFCSVEDALTKDDAERTLEAFYAPEFTYYVFEYSDNDGALGTALEWGGLFRRLPHMRVSKH